MADTPILAANTWPTNAELIADAATLHINPNAKVLDVTYGQGVWWKRYRPADLTIHDLTVDGVDFRALPEPDATFDVVAFDPPYVSVGGRQTTTMPGFHARYGLTLAPTSPAGVQADIDAGLAEVRRVLRRRGLALVKCQDYISSGRLWPGTHLTLTSAFSVGFELVDRFEHIGSPRPQPPGRRQVHARRNLSTLLVLRRAERKRGSA